MTMDKTFSPADAEGRIYETWEESGAFKAGANARAGKDSFCIVIPPPNVNGSLHIGHALNNTLQDILIRWKRMQGFDTLWQPGQDHAGIALQIAVERQMAERGEPSRTELGREAFVDRAWQYKAEVGDAIVNQLKRLGSSCDWSRNRFTMDEGLSLAVRKVFVDLYDKGLIFRGKRLVNWDPKMETAISDLEVENIEVDGHMWHFKYPLAANEKGERATYEYVEKDEDGNVTLRETRDYISIATTRPETMLGDGAVAVHPDDERYAPIVGKLCEIPVGPKEHRRLIPIITDDYPDPDFGSGAVKITGAHDFNDYGVAKRGGIPCYRLMDTKAAMRADGAPDAEEAAKAQAIIDGAEMGEAEIDAINLVPDEYRGLDRFACRKAVIEAITAEGLAIMTDADDPRLGKLKKKVPAQGRDGGDGEATAPGEDPGPVPLVEAKKIMQPFGDRSKVVIEPMLTDQWFVDAETLAKPALEAVKSGETKFFPENWDKTYFHWLENIEPWCISRQLWWGHQIPVWYGPHPDGLELMGRHLKLLRLTTERPDDESLRAQFSETSKQVSAASELFDGAGRVMICSKDDVDALEQANQIYGPKYYVKIADEADGGGFHPDPARGMAQTSGLYFQDENLDLVGVSLVRDPDVLDTWFSSALWPFSTLGWPEKTPELEKYYKTDVLITGNDIIFFWVARMMMTGIKFLDEVPFHSVYINSIVTDAKGKKMSKSVGNVIDPLELIDQYGADAVRFTLASQESQARRQLRLSVDSVEGGRNFGTKIWNAARFAEMNECSYSSDFDPAAVTQTVNKWIVGESAKARLALDKALDEYRFNDAASTLYAHTWRVFCDWYVEFAKPLLQGEDEAAKVETRATMAWALDQVLILLHPVMPFITEELWAQTGTRAKHLIHADWPSYGAEVIDADASAEMAWVIGLIEQIRSVRMEMNVPAGAKLPLTLVDLDDMARGRLDRNAPLVQRLARIETMGDGAAEKGAVTLTMDGATMALPLAGTIDVAAEKARLEKSLAKIGKEAGGLKGKLGNEKFLANAPAEVVAEQRERLVAAEAEAAKLTTALGVLAEIG
ncbi:MAG: valine--tRNA ligase [Pseudomonadota bacterium]